MELHYDLDLFFGNYLDKLKESLFLSKTIFDTEFYKNNELVLSKILFLAYQKGLVNNDLYEILNYIPTNDLVLDIVYNYNGICNRSTLIKVFSIIWEVQDFQTLENEIVVTLKSSDIQEEDILQSQDNQQIIYNEDGLSSLVVGNNTENVILSFIKLFLPVGVLISFQYIIDNDKLSNLRNSSKKLKTRRKKS